MINDVCLPVCKMFMFSGILSIIARCGITICLHCCHTIMVLPGLEKIVSTSVLVSILHKS
jgi:hypothetical protein